MPDKLSALFEQERARTVTWRGRTVHALVERHYPSGTTLRVTIDVRNPTHPQGLRIKVRKGWCRIAGEELDDIVLWSETAPRPIELAPFAKRSDAQCSVSFWNCWQDPLGTTQAWIGNAGMLLEVQAETFRLSCSDGFGAPSFGDLVVTVEPADLA